jgi:hypothetical protein
MSNYDKIKFGQDVHQIAHSVADLLESKMSDYGPNSIADERSILVRLNDKLSRLQNLLNSPGALATNESIEDTWKDAAGYSILGVLKHTGNWPVAAGSGHVYLASPMDAYADDSGNDIALKKIIEKHTGKKVFNPAEMLRVTSESSNEEIAEINARNMQAVSTACAVIAYLPENVRTVGCIIELCHAADLQIPIGVICPGPRHIAFGVLKSKTKLVVTHQTGAQSVYDLLDKVIG